MSQKIIIGNWKMNPLSLREAKDIAKGVSKYSKKYKKTQVILCPPALYALPVMQGFKNPPFALGLQNIFPEHQGSHTGEISADMAKGIDVQCVLAGHSERRSRGETNTDINKQVHAILNAKMIPVLCIGESVRDKDATYLEFLQNEITECIVGLTEAQISKTIIAYEPIWAIGKGEEEAMKGADMYQMFIFIKKIINDLYSGRAAKKVKVLYGGSVSGNNAEDLLVEGHIDGLLIGRQSLYPEHFGEIIKIADNLA